MAHAMNRLQSGYNRVVQAPNSPDTGSGLRLSSYGGVGANRKVDWNNTKSVAKFAEEGKLTGQPTWADLGIALYVGGSTPRIKAFHDAMATFQSQGKLEFSKVVEKAGLLLAKAQDKIIFGVITEPAELSKFLDEFDAEMALLAKSATLVK